MPRRIIRTVLALVAAVSLAGSAPAQDGPKLPSAPKPTLKYPGNDLHGIGPIDPRTTVDQTQLPWRAIGRLQAEGASCTAALVRPAVLLTAAHCVFHPFTHQLFPAEALHFQLAYAEGKYEAEANGVRITVPDNYDPVLSIGTMGNDWALVEIDRPIGEPDSILPMRDRAPRAGDTVALGGYAKDQIERFLVDLHCRVRGLLSDRNGVPMIHHDCTATHGVSGAPLLIEDAAGWTIGGVEVVGSANSGGGASVLYEARKALENLRD